MKIRQKDATRNITQKEIDLRSAGPDGLWDDKSDNGFRTGQASMSVSDNRDDAFSRLSARASFSKDALPLSREEMEGLVSQLSSEERRQWNSYSDYQKQQVILEVEQKVDKTMRYRSSTSIPLQPTFDRKKEILQFYHVEEESKRAAKADQILSDGDPNFLQSLDPVRDVNLSIDSELLEGTQTFTPEQTRELMPLLSEEDRKNWSYYSDSKKSSLLRDAEHIADRRVLYRSRAADTSNPLHDKGGSNDTKSKEKSIRTVTSRLDDDNDKRNGIRKIDDDKKFIYLNQSSKKSDSDSIRKGIRTVEKNYKRTEGRKKNSTPRIKAAAFGAGTAASAAAKRKSVKQNELKALKKKKEREQKASDKADRDKFRQREYFYQSEAAKRKRRSKESQTNGRKRWQRNGRSYRNADYRQQRYKNARKEEQVKRNDAFLNEFKSRLSKDSKKRQNINRQIRQEQISEAELEYETGADALRTATLPIRAGAVRIAHRITASITGALSSLIKYIAPAGGFFIVIVLIVMTIAALFGGIAGETTSGFSSASGEAIVEYAKSFIGITKYVWGAGRGGGDDWQQYADCSSFVHGVYAHFGIQLGSTTYEMENNGTVVEGGLADAMPGDIILFYSGSISPNNSQHVGIYAGDGQMVHCSGGPSNFDVDHAGTGVCMKAVAADTRPYEVRRVIVSMGTTGTGGHNIDPTNYTTEQLQLIWAIVCQEDNGSYDGALAVISTAMNRVDSPQWASLGSNAYQQLTAPGQFCYSIDNYWRQWLGGNVPDYVKQAVSDCLNSGIRNHSYTSFRSGYVQGSEQIGGGNYYFN